MWIDGLSAGAIAGLAAELLVLRVNPEVTQTLRGVFIGMPLWASWGMLMVGVPLIAAIALIQHLRRRPDLWLAPELSALFFWWPRYSAPSMPGFMFVWCRARRTG